MSGSFKASSEIHRDRQKRPTREADTKWLRWAESRFKEFARKDNDVDRESFKKALKVHNVFFADRFFDMLDDAKTGSIPLPDLMGGLCLLNEGTNEDKIRFFYDVFDLDNNGEIDKDELRSLLKTGMDESSVRLSERKLNHLTDTLFTSADQDSNGSISFDEFMETLRRHPQLMESFSIGAGSWLKSTRLTEAVPRHVGTRTEAAAYIRNNIQRIGIVGFLLLINVALFASAAVGYSSVEDSNWSFVIARGAGNALNFNCSVIVLMMLRKTVSFLRSTWLFHILPFDDTIEIHKLIGYTIFVLVVVHTSGHVGNALILQSYKNFTAVELLLTDPTLLMVGLRVGRLSGSAFITGWLLDIVLLVLIVGSLSFLRRSGHFEVFFWTHKICYFLFWFLLILHGPRFWCWFVGPAMLFSLEKFFQMKVVKTLRSGKTYIKEVNLLPSRVTHLVLTRPRHFKYRAGDYMFIQIPKLAPHEWHPFTISSAPEQTDVISVHIRSIGNWTKRLYQLFDELTSQSRTPGNINLGFESSTHDSDGDGNIITVEEFEVEHTTLNSFSDDTSTDSEFDEDDEPRPVLTIRRVSYQPAEELPSSEWKKAHGSLDAVEEENEEKGQSSDEEKEKVDPDIGSDSNSIDVDVDPPAQISEEETDLKPSGNRMYDRRPSKKKTVKLKLSNNGTNGNNSTTVIVEPSSPISPDEAPPAGHSIYDRRLSKPMTKPNVKFDLSTKGKIRVHIQGPYGTPSTSIFQSEHAVLIGAGIGVTPYASILQSIMFRHRANLNECPNCNHSWVDLERQKRALMVKKVDFIWMNRNYEAFEWFVDMILKLENDQSQYSLDRFLDIHLFITGMKRFDMKNIGLQMALDLVHEKENRDLLTGLRTKLQAGRPDWIQLFTQLKAENKGKVSVYFCGAPALGSVISEHCNNFGFMFHSESF